VLPRAGNGMGHGEEAGSGQGPGAAQEAGAGGQLGGGGGQGGQAASSVSPPHLTPNTSPQTSPMVSPRHESPRVPHLQPFDMWAAQTEQARGGLFPHLLLSMAVYSNHGCAGIQRNMLCLVSLLAQRQRRVHGC
jgi:hypothetical protein